MQNWIAVGLSTTLLATGIAASQPGASLVDHGVAAPVGMAVWGGPVATVDADGRRLILMKLWVCSGDRNSSYLFIDAETGASEQIDPGIDGYGAWATFLSPDNKYYDSLGMSGQGNVFVEVDVATRTVEEIGELPRDRPSSMTIDDNGIIYMGMDPGAQLFSFDPLTRQLTDHGPMAAETWRQFPRLATDDAGWVYATITFQKSNLIALNPATGERRALLGEQMRGPVTAAPIWRATDGRVYAKPDPGDQWYRLHEGVATEVDAPDNTQAIFGNTTAAPGVFPDGSRWTAVDVDNRSATIIDAGTNEPRVIHFDYESAGVDIYSVAEGPGGRIHGSTGAPLRIYTFDPATGEMSDGGLASHGGHVNQFVMQGDRMYGGVYGTGSLIEYDPALPVDDRSITQSSNPRHLHGGAEAQPLYGRPHAMLAHPDGEHVLLTGNPYRALVGTGLLIYNTRTGEEVVLGREQLIPDQGIMALAALPCGDVIAGTMTGAATGGTATATEAVVYRLDWATREITNRWIPVPGAAHITDLLVAEDGLVYGLAANSQFFVIDPAGDGIVHRETLAAYGTLAGSQAPRIMALAPDGMIYVLFRNAIVQIEPGTFAHREMVRTEDPISTGIAIVEGRLYFASGPRLWSYTIPLP